MRMHPPIHAPLHAPPLSPQDASLGSVATVVLRGSTEGFLDDVERAVDDGVNAYKVGGRMTTLHTVLRIRLSR